MTDKQFKEFLATRSLDGLMDLLLKYGELYVRRPEQEDEIERGIRFVKEEITNRVMGIA